MILGSPVLYREYNVPSKWSEGDVVKKEGNVTVAVRNKEGEEVRRHVYQLIQRPAKFSSSKEVATPVNPGEEVATVTDLSHIVTNCKQTN